MAKDGGPAFPDADQVAGTGGMSMRDYFAAAAMQGLLGVVSGEDWAKRRFVGASVYSSAAYKIADAMLAARESTDA